MRTETQTHLAFAVTIFAGATLLFAVEPMIARMIVPLLGGAPSVWIICSLCFQTLLLAGYGYVHFVGTRLPLRAQIVLQLLLMAAVFFVLPITVEESVVQRLTASHPGFGVFLLLVRTIGLPFFVLATSSPLLQRWFAELGERDPYHLYAASNAGSMLALFGYPLLVEPMLSVHGQSRVFHTGFAGYTVLVVLCAVLALRRSAAGPVIASGPRVAAPELSARARWRERAIWVGLSFAPSSLLMGATEYVTTEVASVPLLWVLPLALYLLSFIVAFAKKQLVAPALVAWALGCVASFVAAITLAEIAPGNHWSFSKPFLVVAHMVLLFLASVVCHRGLAERRPHVGRLTEFYLLMSIGGVLGGAFNGLVAPVLFDDLYEYPIAVGVACLGRGLGGKPLREGASGLAVGVAAFALIRLGILRWVDPRLGFALLFLVPIVLAIFWLKRPVRFAVAIAGLLLAGMTVGGQLGTVVWADRSFFGVLKVVRDDRFRFLFSGRALEGQQALAAAEAAVPLAYYYPTGPAGDLLAHLPPRPRRVGVVGLGIGSLAAYAKPGDTWTFLELNQAVVDVAESQFTYLKAAREHGAAIGVETGDARLRLREGDAARFDLLVLDAFSSDAVPIHLVTREAIAVYRRALVPGGLLVAHVSNDHVLLRPVFAALARDARMIAVGRREASVSLVELALGKLPSDWLALTDRRSELDLLVRTSDQWKPLPLDPRQSVWTDDFANVLGAVRF